MATPPFTSYVRKAPIMTLFGPHSHGRALSQDHRNPAVMDPLIAEFFLLRLRKGTSQPSTSLGVSLFSPKASSAPIFHCTPSPSTPALVTNDTIEEIDSIESKLEFGNLLGTGKFGEVRVARLKGRDNHPEIAVKIIDTKKWGTGDQKRVKDLTLTHREIENWQLIGGKTWFPQFYGAYIDSAGKLYILLERIEGQTLANYLENTPSSSEARRILLEVSRALRVIHRRGYLHRDISSSNIMISPDGSVKLLDFGAMKQSEAGQFSSTHLFTPGYAAPEILRAEYSEQSDLYALGILWAEMVYGRDPIKVSERDQETGKILYTLPDPEDQQLFQRLVAVVPADRPQNIDEVISALECGVPDTALVPSAPISDPAITPSHTVTDSSDREEINLLNWSLESHAILTGEALAHIHRVLQDDKKPKDHEKIADLEGYLRKIAYWKPHQKLVELAIALIKKRRSNPEIGDALEKMNSGIGVKIFGFTRKQLNSLIADSSLKEDVLSLEDCFDHLSGRKGSYLNLLFRQTIEKFFKMGLSFDEIRSILSTVNNHRLARIPAQEVPHQEMLERIGEGLFGGLWEDERRISQKMDDFSSKSHGMIALFLTLEAQGFVYKGDASTDSFSVENPDNDYYDHTLRRIKNYLFSAGFGAGLGWMIGGSSFGQATLLGGMILTGMRCIAYFVARPEFIQIRYSLTGALEALVKVLDELPPGSIQRFEEALRSVGTTEEGLRPKELLERAREQVVHLLEEKKD